MVDNSPWLQEITLRAADIVAALAREFGPETVRALRVTLGRLEPDPAPAASPEAHPGRRVSDEERRAIEAALAPITDRALGESLRRLLVKTRQFS